MTGLRSSSATRSPQAVARRATDMTTSTKASISAGGRPRAPFNRAWPRGAELAVVSDADDHLDAVAHHLLHEHAVDARRRIDLRGLVDELGEGRPHRISVGDTDLDEADIALVREIGRRDLHDDRVAEEVGGGDGRVCRFHDHLAGEWHTERG